MSYCFGPFLVFQRTVSLFVWESTSEIFSFLRNGFHIIEIFGMRNCKTNDNKNAYLKSEFTGILLVI